MSKKETKSLIPKIRFPEFTSSGSVICQNGNYIFEPISNKDHNSDLPILAITQEYGAIPRDEIDYNVSVSKKSLAGYKVVEKGDFIISLRSFQGGIEYSNYHGICSPAYIILRKKNDIVDQYYKQYFKSRKFINDMNKDLEGIRDGKMVSYKQFSTILLPRPDKKEQQKVANCLSSIDELIYAEEKKLTALTSHKRGLMQKLFPAEDAAVPEWRFPEFRDSGEWEDTTFGDMAVFINGRAYKRDELLQSGKYRVLRVGNIFSNKEWYYSDLELEETKYCENGDLLYAWSATFGPQIWNGEKVIYHYHIWKVEQKYDISKDFLFVLLDYETEKMKSKSANGLGLLHITKGTIEGWKCRKPKILEQEKIASFILGLNKIITEQEKKIKELKLHKKGLVQGLFPSLEEVVQ